MTPPLRVHFLLHLRHGWHVTWCGLPLVDPDGERWTKDAVKVTCRACRRLAKIGENEHDR